MKITSPDNRGWAKVKKAAKYADVSERTFRDWLKDGLRHSRVRGTILISYAALDEYLMGFDDASEEDIRIVVKGVEVVMVPETMPLLEEAVMDYVELKKGDFRFIFSNPREPNYSPPTEE